MLDVKTDMYWPDPSLHTHLAMGVSTKMLRARDIMPRGSSAAAMH